MIDLGLPGADGPFRVLCLGAHADDIEIGCGGTILRLSRARALEVRWVVFSGAGPRRGEAKASAAGFLAGAAGSNIEVLDFRDGHFQSARSEIKDAIGVVRNTFEPDLVLTHDERDLHQDHRTLGQVTREAFRSHLILGYEIPKFDGGLQPPNVFVTLDDETRRRKIELLMAGFPSQGEKSWFTPATFDGLMRLRGVECAASSGWAEGFHGAKLRLAP